jgi:hypothetical protein
MKQLKILQTMILKIFKIMKQLKISQIMILLKIYQIMIQQNKLLMTLINIVLI